jgi:membrane-associated phospholipid phosphatase
MKSAVLLLLILLCGTCHAATDALSDALWLADPVSAILAAAEPPEATEVRPPSYSPKGPEGFISADYARLLWDDTKEIAAGPVHWDADEWRDFGLITGGLAVTIAFLDKPIRDAAQSNRSSSTDDFFRNIEKFGTKQYGLPVLAGFYVVGLATDNYNAKTVALDGFSASVLSALTTSIIKGVAGRARPNTGLGPHHWNLFGGDQSFPSGHATGAFAFASVIAGHYDNVWVATASYTIASLVGVARIEQDAHWTSDVIAGGLIGGVIGHHLVNFNENWRKNHDLALAPDEIGTDGRQLTFTWKF